MVNVSEKALFQILGFKNCTFMKIRIAVLLSFNMHNVNEYICITLIQNMHNITVQTFFDDFLWHVDFVLWIINSHNDKQKVQHWLKYEVHKFFFIDCIFLKSKNEIVEGEIELIFPIKINRF